MRILLPLMMPGMMPMLSSKTQEIKSFDVWSKIPFEFALELRPRLFLDYM